MKDEQYENLRQRAGQLLDESVGHMDAGTLSRLHQARSRAVDSMRRRPLLAAWLPAGAVATIAVAIVAVALWQPGGEQAGTGQPELTGADVELLTSAESLELIDDWEFYEWLDIEEQAGQGAGA